MARIDLHLFEKQAKWWQELMRNRAKELAKIRQKEKLSDKDLALIQDTFRRLNHMHIIEFDGTEKESDVSDTFWKFMNYLAG